MKRREFNRIMKQCTTGKRLDVAKASALDDEVKADVVQFLVRNRLPIILQFLGPKTDRDWLACCGYMEVVEGKQSGYTFLTTTEYRVIYGIC